MPEELYDAAAIDGAGAWGRFRVRLIPQYLLFQRLGWIDTYYPLIVPAWLGGGAVTIFLPRQFFLTIPRDLDRP